MSFSKSACFTACIAFAIQAAAAMPPAADPSFEKACETLACQHDVRVALLRKDGSAYDQTFKRMPPVVQSIGVAILAGQTLFLEAEMQGDRLVNIKVVPAVADKSKTITASFQQMDNKGMMLTLTNPFPRPLKFDMGIMLLNSESLAPTSSCPIRAGLSLFEGWPQPIFQVLLRNGRFLDSGASMVCS